MTKDQIPTFNTDVTLVASGSSSKTTPVDADSIVIIDSAASNVFKRLTWANLKTALATVFASLTGAAFTGNVSSTGNFTTTSNMVAFDGQSGSAKFGGFSLNWTSRNSNFAFASIRYACLMDASVANRVITVPAGSGQTWRFMAIKSDATANTVTLTPTGTDTLGGKTSIVLLKQNDFVVIESEGTAVSSVVNYRVIAGNILPYDIEISEIGKGIIMKSPNGTRMRLTPSDAGAPVFTSL